jgi:hypothetical protein
LADFQPIHSISIVQFRHNRHLFLFIWRGFDVLTAKIPFFDNNHPIGIPPCLCLNLYSAIYWM